jgi:hypothetical protein
MRGTPLQHSPGPSRRKAPLRAGERGLGSLLWCGDGYERRPPAGACRLLLGQEQRGGARRGHQQGASFGEIFSCSSRPVRVVGALAFRTVDAGAYCWGDNDLGELGVGTSAGPEECFGGTAACSSRPVKVVGGLAFRAVNVGLGYSCGLTTEDLAYCWGDNTAGQLGNGTDSSVGETRPVAVVSP